MKLLVSGMVVLACASQVLAATVTVKSSADSPMIGAMPTTNRGLGGQHYWDNGDTMLLKFDLSGLPAGKVVKSATLEFFSGHEGPYEFDWQVTAHAMRSAWQEGIGTTSGAYGSIGFPWGPTSIGDATFRYRQVTATALDAGLGVTVATDGVAWEVAGGLGTSQDCFPDLLIDQAASGPLTLRGPGTSLVVLNLTAAGCNTLTSWINDPAANHGMVVRVTGTGNWRVATREHSGTPGTAGPYAPLLTLDVAVPGDINDDGSVDIFDLLILADNWDKCAGDSGYDDRADLSDDGCVDIFDLLILADHWNT